MLSAKQKDKAKSPAHYEAAQTKRILREEQSGTV
jgi:hypothetical protein